ncbi:unnamed protein product [Larinioides sclopetarius]|uniref:Uncharacterized protein n=1 Tax=Larinioides sclopetarius TaxID=280406 RepID=A0AAV2BHL7_9ARAC
MFYRWLNKYNYQSKKKDNKIVTKKESTLPFGLTEKVKEMKWCLPMPRGRVRVVALIWNFNIISMNLKCPTKKSGCEKKTVT